MGKAIRESLGSFSSSMERGEVTTSLHFGLEKPLGEGKVSQGYLNERMMKKTGKLNE